MSSCLGLYIDSKIIKYAKVTKDKNATKVESFGFKVYENLQATIDQIVAETFSYKVPISINLPNEEYQKMKIFSLLSQKDIASVIKTEFDNLHEEKHQNKDAFEYRYILADDIENPEKTRAISAIANKADIVKISNGFEGKKISTIVPLGMSVANLVKTKKKENVLIINIEEKTTITTLVNEKIYDVETMDIGAIDILENINRKENSYSKSYEICKNATIYTNENRDLQYEENIYIDEIMPTLYEIVGRIRRITNESLNRINKIYITGTASVINNIDIYFQEYLTDVECEILQPYFINQKNNKINMKDYIEVNSAISLALSGLGEIPENINFKKVNILEKISSVLQIEKTSKKEKVEKKDVQLQKIEKDLISSSIILAMVLVVYIVFSLVLTNMLNDRKQETTKAISQMQTEIDKVNKDKDTIAKRTDDYEKMLKDIQESSQYSSEKQRYKNTIPTLLSEIMFVIPKNVQLTSIENTSDTHIVIKAQAEKYEQLGYFKGRLKTDNILTNVISDSGQKQNGVIVVTIEGELP